jgi:hypothetical protein
MPRKRKRKTLGPAELTEDQILAWCDAYHKLTGRWPTRDSRPRVVQGAPAERWSAINDALNKGHRGLPGGSSLPRLLAARRGRRNRKALPRLTVRQILKWCDAHHRRTGSWPHNRTALRVAIPGSGGETWSALDTALVRGARGLPGGSSLARVLAEHRGVRNVHSRPRMTVRQILAWADAWYARTGHWPKQKDWRQPIPGSQGETWGGVIQAVAMGLRGFPGGFSLFDLLAKHRGARNVGHLPPLTIRQILAWADEFHAEMGEWPCCRSSPQVIAGSGGERWFNVDQALRKGLRGLSRGSSLSKVLAEHRGATFGGLPPLSVEQILDWADAFHARTGDWPTKRGTPQLIDGTRGERWDTIDSDLSVGRRGLPGGTTLAKLLAERRGVLRPRTSYRPPLNVKQILAWADAFRAKTGQWPTIICTPQEIPGSGGERWAAVSQALRNGLRGLPGGSSLPKLLAKRRGVPLTVGRMKARMARGRR